MNRYEDEFKVRKNSNDIVCFSKSGNTYYLGFDDSGIFTCSCKGFKIRGTCRHIREAREQEYFAELVYDDTKKERDNFCLANSTENLFVVCYKEHENHLIVNAEQLITVLDYAKKQYSTLKVFKLGEKVIDWA